ncbi:hypothetical protein DU504_09840 [Haloplanus salinus]|uniref:Uncharacterized protein n=1 Tax=Haloplanus salinus TaxID=1126245 RepID=A0A368NDV2_9EURY|nr:hypothetical protein DU504_09840 [Haloplanus salinus]
MSRYTRRRLMLLVTAAGAGLAGCTSPAEPSADDADTTSVTSATTGETGTAADELDLREANVVAVAVEPAAGGHRFDVTLHHDDDGEEGYANWWQVETLDGERLGRRDLAHPHGTREFTRSATVSVPDGTTCVVVRGHDRTHGYGGRVILVNVATGATTAVRQGPEREPMDGRACQ